MNVKVKRSIHMKASLFHDRTITTCNVKIAMTRYAIRRTKLHIVAVIDIKECIPFRYQL